MYNHLKFILIFTSLFLAFVLHGQPEDVDFATSTYESIHLWIIGLLTYLWGQVGKFVPGISNKALPRAAVVAAGGIAVAIIAIYQGVGAIMENIMAVLSTLGVYDILTGIGKKSSSE